MPPSYIRVRAVVWAYGRGQSDTQTDARDHNTFCVVYDSRKMYWLSQNTSHMKIHLTFKSINKPCAATNFECETKNHKFCCFLDFGILWCHQFAAIQESWTQSHDYKPSPIQPYQNRFCSPVPSWQNWAHKLWRSKAWRTKRWTKTQRFWPPRPRVKSEPHQTWHSDRGPRARSCTSKTFAHPAHSFAYRGAKILGKLNPLN